MQICFAHGLNGRHTDMCVRSIAVNVFSQLTDDKGYPERFQRWRQQWKERSKTFSTVVDGRIRNTSVEEAVWLSSETCMRCHEKPALMSMTTLMAEGPAMMIGLRLCEKHFAEAQAQSNPILAFIAEKTGVCFPFAVETKKVRHDDEMIAMSCDAARSALGCEIEKMDGNTITAVRPSGVRVIIRQDSFDNYAHNIQTPGRKPLSRIDSAPHHPIEHGPDHVHLDLSPRTKNQVESSFTYGFAFADMKAIKQLIEDAEARWGSRSSVGHL